MPDPRLGRRLDVNAGARFAAEQCGGQNCHVDVEFADGVTWLARIRLEDSRRMAQEVLDQLLLGPEEQSDLFYEPAGAAKPGQLTIDFKRPLPARDLLPRLGILKPAVRSSDTHQQSRTLFDQTKINVVNRARGGRSSRTFQTEGL